MAKRTKSVLAQRSKRATLRDIARVAGCSTAVASTVVNRARGRSGASEQLVRRIRKAARDLGYRPHFASRSLARQTTETIGVYVPPGPGVSLGYQYEGQILVGIESTCQQRTYDILVVNLGCDGPPHACLHKFVEGRIDGLLLLHVWHESPWVAELASEYPNVVGVNYYARPCPISTVNFDDRAAARQAVMHLVELGHRRIGYVGTGRDAGPGDELRYQGFREAARESGLTVRREWVHDYAVTGSSQRQTGIWGDEQFGAATAEVFAEMGPEAPTAIVCYDDQVAASAMLRLGELGVRVPSGMSVVGIDDAMVCSCVRPKLTSVRQPLEEMGRRAAALVIDMAVAANGEEGADGGETEGGRVHELKPPELIIRESTAPPRP